MKLKRKKLLDMQIFSEGKLKEKRGSTSVFLMIILGSMISLTFAFIQIATYYSNISYMDGVLNLAGRSVLSEFNKDLKKEYGLIAFRGTEEEISYKLTNYINYTLEYKPKLTLESISSDTSFLPMNNTDAFEKEIAEYTKFAMARDLIDKEGEGNRIIQASDKVIRNGKIIEGLPSKEFGEDSGFIDNVLANIGNLSTVFTDGTDEFLINRYIMMHFKSGTKDMDRDTFFENECEYLLYGNMADSKNQKEFRRDLKTTRNGINFIFLLMDPEKSQEISAAAAILTPGPLAPVTKLALTETWAYVEAENDVNLLENGKKVPLQKNKRNWATDLDSIINNKEIDYIDTNCETGLTYNHYLEIFLYFRDRETKLVRVMDLIQINMKGLHDESFLIKEHNFGYSFKAKVNGREYDYYEKY